GHDVGRLRASHQGRSMRRAATTAATTSLNIVVFPPGRPPMFSGALATPPSATRLSGVPPDPWLCVPASRRVCLYREGVFPAATLSRRVPRGQTGCRLRRALDLAG